MSSGGPPPGGARRVLSLGPLSSFREGISGREVEGVPVAVCRRGDAVWVLHDECPHHGARFSEVGRLLPDTLELMCTWHFWTFALETGRHTHLRTVCLRRWDVRVVDGEVELELA